MSDGCWSQDSATITLKYPFDFFMPNAFTPNGDGANDTYFMLGSKVLNVDRFQIFDRYGEMLWDMTEPWTGYYKGVLLNPGVYIYYIKVSYKDEVRIGKGSVTLLR
jgi:gliding motility-associated-like protein